MGKRRIQTRVINRYNLERVPSDYYEKIYSKLMHLSNQYTGLNGWYYRVWTELVWGKREIILKENDSDIVGISILKNSVFEKKICTLYIDEKYRGVGIGSNLIDQSMLILKTPTPLITVSSNRITELTPLLENKGFALTETYPNYYIEGLTEYSFNGRLRPKFKLEFSNLKHMTQNSYLIYA